MSNEQSKSVLEYTANPVVSESYSMCNSKNISTNSCFTYLIGLNLFPLAPNLAFLPLIQKCFYVQFFFKCEITTLH